MDGTINRLKRLASLVHISENVTDIPTAFANAQSIDFRDQLSTRKERECKAFFEPDKTLRLRGKRFRLTCVFATDAQPKVLS